MTSVAGDTVFFSLYEEELGGTRPDRLCEARPQHRVQRCTVEQIVDTALIVPSLDVPVPQMVNQLLGVCRQLDTPIPEQVIEVPKISSFRRVRFEEQMAEQLVEVSTIISYSWLRGIVEQNVDIPVPRGSRDLLSAVSSSGLPGMANQGKKVRGRARTRGRNCSPSRAHPRRRVSWHRRFLMRASGRTMLVVCECSFPVVGGNFWARTQKSGGQGEGWDGALVMRQPTGAIGSIS